jgi:hemolysin activation/secretion protein
MRRLRYFGLGPLVLALQILLLGPLLFASVASAQSTLPTPQQLNPGERALAPAPAGKPYLIPPPEPAPCPYEKLDAAANIKLKLTGVDIDGADTLPESDLAQAYDGYLDRPIAFATLCTIRDRLSEIVFHAGVFARVAIPEQRFSHVGDAAQKMVTGRLKLIVVEAYVAAIDVHGEPAARAQVESYIERLREMRPFNINTAERYLELASDIPGIQIVTTMKPSRQGPGAVALDVEVSRVSWVSGLVGADNLGSQAVGPGSALARVDFNALTRLGERTSLIVSDTFDSEEQRVVQAIEQVPIGDDGVIASASVAFAFTKPGTPLASADFVGHSFAGLFDVSYPLVRSRRLNVKLTLGFDNIEQLVAVGTSPTPPLTHDKLDVLRARADAHVVWPGLPVVLDGGLELRKGLNVLGASHTGDVNLSRALGRPDAFVVAGDGSASIQWFPAELPRVSTYVAFAAQYSGVPLLSYEQLAAGDLTIGRGYDPSVLTGDSGAEGSFEGRFGPYRVGDFLAVRAFGFYDVEYLHSRSNTTTDQTLHSTGAGLTFFFGSDGVAQALTPNSYLRADILYAHPMDVVFRPPRPGDRVLFNISIGF